MDKLDNIKRDKTNESVLGALSEDELLAFSQESVQTTSSKGASHSTPRPTVTANTAKGAGQSTPRKENKTGASTSGKVKKHRKSSGSLLKVRYQRALFILAKIAKNEREGKVHERDAEDKIRYEAVVKEYQEAISKRNENAQQPEAQPMKASSKRNRSLDAGENSATRSKKSRNFSNQGVEVPCSSSAAAASTKAAYSEVARDHLQLALVDAKSNCGKGVLALWGAIEGRLSGMVVDHVLANKGPTPCFDSDEICRGCRVIKCADEFSRVFLEKCVTAVSDAWEGLSLKLIPASEIPRRPRARIWLPKMKLDGSQIIQCLKAQNPEVPMDDWSVIKIEEPQKNSSSALLLITNESLGALERQQYKLRFGLRMAKVKIFPASAVPDDNLEDVEADAKRLFEGLRLSGTDGDSEAAK